MSDISPFYNEEGFPHGLGVSPWYTVGIEKTCDRINALEFPRVGGWCFFPGGWYRWPEPASWMPGVF